MAQIFVCDQGHRFHYPAKRIVVDLPIPEQGQMIAIASEATGYEPKIETMICPFCHSLTFSEVDGNGNIVETMKADLDQVKTLVKEGWQVHALYQSSATLIKVKGEEGASK